HDAISPTRSVQEQSRSPRKVVESISCSSPIVASARAHVVGRSSASELASQVSSFLYLRLRRIRKIGPVLYIGCNFLIYNRLGGPPTAPTRKRPTRSFTS